MPKKFIPSPVFQKQIVAVIILAISIMIHPLFAAVPSLTNPNVKAVTQGVYALFGDMDVPNAENQGFICNTVFFLTSKGVVVVDPGGSRQVGEMVIREIKKVTDKPVTHVINTHHHADHWMGNDAFARLQPKPKIIGHTMMRQTAEEIGERWLGILNDMTDGANKGTEVVIPRETIASSQTLEIGGQEVVLYHPEHAHTRGDLAVFLPARQVLITGDILFFKRTPGWQDASPKGNVAALQYFLTLEPKHVVPGHGPLTDTTGIRYMLDYAALLRSEVKKFYDEGLADFEMKDKIDIGEYRTMSGFQQRFGNNVNRMYLEIEAESF